MKVAIRILLTLVFLALVFIGIVLIGSSVNAQLLERYYLTIVIVSLALSVIFLVVLLIFIAWIVRRRIKRIYGSILTIRLMVIFAIIGVVPGLIIYAVSLQIISKSIETWFDLPIERALQSGLGMSQQLIEQNLRNLLGQAQKIIQNNPSDLLIKENLADLKIKTHLRSISLFDETGKLLETTDITNIAPPGEFELKQAKVGFAGVLVDVVNNELKYRIKAILAFPNNPNFILQIDQALSDELGHNAQLIEQTYSSYLTRNLARGNLNDLYVLNLSLVMLLALLSTIVAAFYFSKRFSAPLLHLAEGVRLIGMGQYQSRPAEVSADELGSLTASFEGMTQKLQIAQSEIKHNQAELEAAKTHLELILSNMNAGVIVLDAQFKIVQCNYSADHILGITLSSYIGKSLDEIEDLKTFAVGIKKGFSNEDNNFDSYDEKEWQRQFDISHQDHEITLWARGSTVTHLNTSRYIVVFDDMTQTISAQRMSAWGEVAKRLAHEIRNPLTPIQLSAERLIHKIAPNIPANEAKVLIRSAETITQQVDALKRLVDDFRNFADVQPAEKNPVDLNELVQSITDLYADETVNIQLSLMENLPMILADNGQIRQILHNLIKNAIEACTQNAQQKNITPQITLITHLVKFQDSKQRSSKAVQLQIVDNGGGVPAKILPQIFDPYVTSKIRGTGLGMAVVKKIIDDHQARIEVKNKLNDNNEVMGACVTILFTRCKFTA